MRRFWYLVLLGGLMLPALSAAEDSAAEFIEFEDFPLADSLQLPEWFKLSFLELSNDLQDVRESGKRGLLLYFGQSDCPYCKVHLEKNWGDRGIVTYTQKYFDVVAINVRGDRPVSDFKGKLFESEKLFAASLKTDFTPSLIFYDHKGYEILRIAGYHPPYQFRAILEYVADKHYVRETLQKYLSRGDIVSGYEETEMHNNPVFSPPPHQLGRNQIKGGTPLAVFFEQPTCHACDVLHSGPMKDKKILKKLKKMDVVQLDRFSNTPVLTPDGKRMTAASWSEKLGLYYSPTIIIFDEGGKEIIQIDSVVGLYRLNGVLDYILSGGYRKYSTYQLWRQRNMKKSNKNKK